MTTVTENPKQVKSEKQAEALSRALTGQSWSNFPAIIQGFTSRGIPEDQIEPLADDYESILEGLGGDLQSIVGNIGPRSLYQSNNGMAVYEYTTVDGTKTYPVIFSVDACGEWRMTKF